MKTTKPTTPNAPTMPTPDAGKKYDQSQFHSVYAATLEIRSKRTGQLRAHHKAAIVAAVETHKARAIHAANIRTNTPATDTTTPAQRMKKTLRQLAVLIGNYHHTNIKPLYSSRRASVVYGEASAGVDYNAYSKSYGHAARWMNAGARIETRDGHRVIVLQNHRGKDVATYPARELFTLYITKRLSHAGTLDGDLYIVPTMKRNGHTTRGDRYRYDEKRGQFVKSGIAVEFDKPDGTGKYYEHGKTYRACVAEHARKWGHYQHEQYQAQQRRDANELQRQQNAKIKRAARLIAKLCPKLRVTFEDARAVGYCSAGIEAYCKRRHLPTDATDAATIRRAEAINPVQAHAPNGEKVIQYAAQRAATEMLRRHN